MTIEKFLQMPFNKIPYILIYKKLNRKDKKEFLKKVGIK